MVHLLSCRNGKLIQTWPIYLSMPTSSIHSPHICSQAVPCTLWQHPTFRALCCCRNHVTSAVRPLFTQRRWGHTTSSRFSPAPSHRPTPVLQRTLSISHVANSTMELSGPPILLHHLSLQERRSRHRHHDNHVRLFQSTPNTTWDLACVWVSWVGLGPSRQLPHDVEAGPPHVNTWNLRPSQSFE